MRYDYSSIGFYTFDCLGRPVANIPPGGGTQFIEEIDLAVSGAAGAPVIAAAKHGLKCLAVGGVGDDLMAGWVLERLAHFGIDTSAMQRLTGVGTSTSIILTRADGSRPALHMKGATGAFVITPDMWDQVLDATVVHLGGVGLMDRMDGPPSAELLPRPNGAARSRPSMSSRRPRRTSPTSSASCRTPTISCPRSRRRASCRGWRTSRTSRASSSTRA